MLNIPEVKLGVVAVSRDCFPSTLSLRRRQAVVAEAEKRQVSLYEAKTIVENENDALKALDEVKAAGVNALVVFLGNFGPEGPETLLAAKFGGPVMFAAAAEETKDDLINGRGDAYCGMLNASYNLGLRNVRAYIPEYPVGTASRTAENIADFEVIARVILGVKNLKILAFGPRPFDFLACNAPIKPLYDLGAEIQENSELDLFAAYNAHAGDPRIDGIVADMEKELGAGNKQPGVLRRLAQYEATLLDWAEKNKGASPFVAFANKCWPAFQTQFGFVPCYVNGRLAGRGIPVACETDIYGALTEYMIILATLQPPALLDINNTVPRDLYDEFKENVKDYKPCDMFMGFHCGNGTACTLKDPEMKYQLIMKRALEPDGEPDITRGTLEGDIKPSEITLFRLQSAADTALKAYLAEGEVLDVPSRSFGTIGVIAVDEMARFYRHVLVAGRYPHHAGVAFKKVGKVLFEALKLLGVTDIGINLPKEVRYPGENPWK
ncbi:MAG: fucose isomerase [Clostridiales bacterium]|jgi:L-fucose isomerase-like protein|nr:fucose isomerase [Clostridiales bacterium]